MVGEPTQPCCKVADLYRRIYLWPGGWFWMFMKGAVTLIRQAVKNTSIRFSFTFSSGIDVDEGFYRYILSTNCSYFLVHMRGRRMRSAPLKRHDEERPSRSSTESAGTSRRPVRIRTSTSAIVRTESRGVQPDGGAPLRSRAGSRKVQVLRAEGTAEGPSTTPDERSVACSCPPRKVQPRIIRRYLESVSVGWGD